MTSTRRPVRRAGRIAAPAGLALAAVLTGSLALIGVFGPTQASAVPAHAPHGKVQSARQNTTDHSLRVSGFAYDGGAGQSHRSVRVSLFVNGTYRRSLVADKASRSYDHEQHIRGRHAFSTVIDLGHKVRAVRVQAHSAGHRGPSSADTRHVRQYTPAAARIVRVARHYVGSRYSYGADGPKAFDCSGYSSFVYRKAHIAHLPHSSQAQQHAKHMHKETRSQARPGDLVFYLSGNSAYHVSIYAGHGKQYSATDPSQGVEHSRISSHHVVFKTDWH